MSRKYPKIHIVGIRNAMIDAETLRGQAAQSGPTMTGRRPLDRFGGAARL